MQVIKKESWASAKFNEKFIVIDTYSGYISEALDPEGPQYFLTLNVENIKLGLAILNSLKHSRWINLDEISTFYHPDKLKDQYAKWVKNLMEKYEYKTKRALFKNMNACNIRVCENEMQISPLRHEKLEGWGAEKGDNLEPVILPADSSPEEVGAALRLAFSRCY